MERHRRAPQHRPQMVTVAVVGQFVSQHVPLCGGVGQHLGGDVHRRLGEAEQARGVDGRGFVHGHCLHGQIFSASAELQCKADIGQQEHGRYDDCACKIHRVQHSIGVNGLCRLFHFRRHGWHGHRFAHGRQRSHVAALYLLHHGLRGRIGHPSLHTQCALPDADRDEQPQQNQAPQGITQSRGEPIPRKCSYKQHRRNEQ